MAETEQLIRTEDSIQVISTEGRHESLLVQDIGGAMLLSLAGHTAPQSLENAPDTSVTAFDRDTLKYDIADWLKKRAVIENGTDPEALTSETMSALLLLNEYRIASLDVDRRNAELTNISAKEDAVGRNAAQLIMTKLIQEAGGTEVVQQDQDLQRKIIEEARAAAEEALAQITDDIAAKKLEIDQIADEVDGTLGPKVEAFKETGSSAAKFLVQPFRELIALGLLTPESATFEGMIHDIISFSKYGPSSKKLALYVPVELNAQRIPLSYMDAQRFAETLTVEASKSTSIFG